MNAPLEQAVFSSDEPRALPRVSVLVVNFHGGDLVVDSVHSALRSTVNVELIVVDNASSDGSREALLRAFSDDRRVHLICNADNAGFARAVNQAIARGRGDYFLLLNPDCIVRPDTIEQLIGAMESREDAGMAGCVIRNPDGSEQAGCRRAVPTPWRSLAGMLKLSRLFPEHPAFGGVVLRDQPLPLRPVDQDAISGAFMLVKREALEDIGGLDEGYFLHCEDLDWCMRFHQGEWKVLFVPGVEVVHYKGFCSQRRPLRVLWHKHRGMVRFYNKFFRRRYPRSLMVLVAAGVWLRFSVLAVISLVRRLTGRRRKPLVGPHDLRLN